MMVSLKEPKNFNDTITIDFLFKTYKEHQNNVRDLSLSELHSLELPMPKFNTLASLNKTEFNKIMMALRRKGRDSKELFVMIAAITDTLTCMIKGNKFYEGFDEPNNSFELLFDLLLIIKNSVILERTVGQQLTIFLNILEKCADRIKHVHHFYERMQIIISELKRWEQDIINKENNDCEHKSKVYIRDDAPLLPLNNNLVETHTKKPQIVPNAFEIMMRSSKMLKKK